MSDLSFGPIKNSDTPKPKTGQLVTLGTALFVLQARYTSPLDGAEKPIPKHRWALIGSKDGIHVLAHIGTASDSDGVSSISATDDMNDPDMTWHLSWQPAFDDVADLNDWIATKEAWIDLDKTSNDKAAWVATRSLAALEQRRLIRMPAWSSVAKATNGKFIEVPNPGFDATGRLTAIDVVTKLASGDTFGTRTKPWRIQVDFNWFRAFLHFRFFDFKKKDERIVPPGLLVRATTRAGATVGGGTAIDGEGTIFVLHERTKESVALDVNYQFETPDKSIVDLDAPAPAGPPPAAKDADRRVVTAHDLPDGATKRYLLPNAWSSSAMEAFLEGASSRDRKNFFKLRAEETSLGKPLAFHLDDVVLFDSLRKERVLLDKDSRVVLFDHRLAFRGPFDPQLPNVLKEKVSGDYLRAEDLIVRKGEAFADSTFVIHHEGDFFVLREERLTGPMGKTPKLGARLAEARAEKNPIGDFLLGYPKMGRGTCELHFLPDAYDGPYEESREGKFLENHPAAKMCHLLVVVPMKVVQAEIGDKSFNAPTAADVVPATALPFVFQGLLDAAERWDQAHPAHGSTAGKKDYVVTSASGQRVVKLRHYFAIRRDGKESLTVHATFKNNGTLRGDRSFVSSSHAELSLVLNRPPDTAELVDTSRFAHDSDDVRQPSFALAHELGHVMGLPDEYLEPLDFGAEVPDARSGPTIPRFGQSHEAYPFNDDNKSMMKRDLLPRLRYLWHHVDALLNNPPPEVKAPSDGPYLARYSDFARGITYQIPDGNEAAPWQPLGQHSGPAGRSPLVLYRTGDDETTVEALFKRPAGISAAPGSWLQGILVVTPKIWFNFLPGAARDFNDDEERFVVLRTLQSSLYTDTRVLKQRFMIEGSLPTLPRIAILFQPRMELGTSPQFKSGFKGDRVTESAADVVVDVVNGKPSPFSPSLPRFVNSRLQIENSDAGLSILRFALGILPTPVANNAPMTARELAPLARAVSEMLHDPPGSPPRVVKDMP